jgi:hypothetical protein
MAMWVKRADPVSGWWRGTSGRVQTKVNGDWKISPVTTPGGVTMIGVFTKIGGVWVNTPLSELD